MFNTVILSVAPKLTQAEYRSLLPLVSKEKQERIRLFRVLQDAQNTLLGDVLIRTEICRVTCLSNWELEFSVNEYGKPFLINSACVHFSISHSKNYVVCSIANEPVGIDIEVTRPIDIKIAERFFAPDEVDYISRGQSTKRFFEIWTKKESRIKWEGKGLSIPLSSFSVLDPSELEMLNYFELNKNNEFICHVCSTIKEKPSIKEMDTATMMQYIKTIHLQYLLD